MYNEIGISINNLFNNYQELTIIIFVVLNLLNFDGKSSADKKDIWLFEKRFLIIQYLFGYILYLHLVNSVLIPIFNYKIFLIMSYVWLLLNIIFSVINQAHEIKKEEILFRLSNFQVLKLKLWEWFFSTKSYIYIFAPLTVILFHNAIPEDQVGSKVLAGLIVMCCFFFYHLFIISFDGFGVKELSNLSNKIFKYKIPNSPKKGNTTLFDGLFVRKGEFEVDLRHFVTRLATVIYIEDQDYLVRKTYSFKIISVLKRKLSDKPKKKNKRRRKAWNIWNYLNRNYKRYKRGYSTIGSQLVRVNLMQENSYKYTYRRKIFVENILTNYFYKAMEKEEYKYYPKKKDLSRHDKKLLRSKTNNNIRLYTLMSYYDSILKNPETNLDLYSELADQSRASLSEIKDRITIGKEHIEENEQVLIRILEDCCKTIFQVESV